jgi:protein-L-isoaspartate(D-aspartate) O-methyltransferase
MASLDQASRLAWLAALADTIAKRSRGGAPGAYPLELTEVARGCRLGLVDAVERQLGPFDRSLLDAVLEVSRERFVQPADLARSADDAPLPLDDEGLATISAPHAYCLSFRLLSLSKGDRLVELGAGTGYGAALGAYIVGPTGHVTTFEIDPALARRARILLSAVPNVTVVEGDAVDSAARWSGSPKVVVTFAVETLPEAWLEALPEGGMLVAPVGPADGDQHLVLATKRGGTIARTHHGAVRYVKNRSRL